VRFSRSLTSTGPSAANSPQPGELIAFVPFAGGILVLSRRLLRKTRPDPLPEWTFVQPLQALASPTEPLKRSEELPFDDFCAGQTVHTLWLRERASAALSRSCNSVAATPLQCA
jgi:hypothetical protein